MKELKSSYYNICQDVTTVFCQIKLPFRVDKSRYTDDDDDETLSGRVISPMCVIQKRSRFTATPLPKESTKEKTSMKTGPGETDTKKERETDIISA